MSTSMSSPPTPQSQSNTDLQRWKHWRSKVLIPVVNDETGRTSPGRKSNGAQSVEEDRKIWGDSDSRACGSRVDYFHSDGALGRRHWQAIIIIIGLSSCAIPVARANDRARANGCSRWMPGDGGMRSMIKKSTLNEHKRFGGGRSVPTQVAALSFKLLALGTAPSRPPSHLHLSPFAVYEYALHLRQPECVVYPSFKSPDVGSEANEVSALVEAAMTRTLSSCLLEVFAFGHIRERWSSKKVEEGFGKCGGEESLSVLRVSNKSLLRFSQYYTRIAFKLRLWLCSAIVPPLTIVFAIRISTLKGPPASSSPSLDSLAAICEEEPRLGGDGATYRFMLVVPSIHSATQSRQPLKAPGNKVEFANLHLLRLGSLETPESESPEIHPAVNRFSILNFPFMYRWHYLLSTDLNVFQTTTTGCVGSIEARISGARTGVDLNIEHVYWCWGRKLKTSMDSDPGGVMSRFFWLPSANWRILPTSCEICTSRERAWMWMARSNRRWVITEDGRGERSVIAEITSVSFEGIDELEDIEQRRSA
ncbi:hypothetical protein C8F01DRAFT_1234327 [Mycena amicta]|nr:hypothetical protein C8F01DRAFT_1234327 [Mycena amicta]